MTVRYSIYYQPADHFWEWANRVHAQESPPCSNWRRSKWQATKTKLLRCTRWTWPSWALGTSTSEVDAAAVPVAASAPSAPSFESGSCSEGPSWKGGEGQAAKLVVLDLRGLGHATRGKEKMHRSMLFWFLSRDSWSGILLLAVNSHLEHALPGCYLYIPIHDYTCLHYLSESENWHTYINEDPPPEKKSRMSTLKRWKTSWIPRVTQLKTTN